MQGIISSVGNLSDSGSSTTKVEYINLYTDEYGSQQDIITNKYSGQTTAKINGKAKKPDGTVITYQELYEMAKHGYFVLNYISYNGYRWNFVSSFALAPNGSNVQLRLIGKNGTYWTTLNSSGEVIKTPYKWNWIYGNDQFYCRLPYNYNYAQICYYRQSEQYNLSTGSNYYSMWHPYFDIYRIPMKWDYSTLILRGVYNGVPISGVLSATPPYYISNYTGTMHGINMEGDVFFDSDTFIEFESVYVNSSGTCIVEASVFTISTGTRTSTSLTLSSFDISFV